jgi:hypothetical protein
MIVPLDTALEPMRLALPVPSRLFFAAVFLFALAELRCGKQLLVAIVDITSQIRNIPTMKAFNAKIAIRTFWALLALESVLFTLMYRVPSDWNRELWWTVNFPGYNLGDVIGRSLVHHGVVFRDSSLLIGIGLGCTLLWSALLGSVFHRKAVADRR